MKFALCNEVLREMPFPEQCRYASALGYRGIELAPFTLSDEPHMLPASRRREIKRMAEDAGAPVIGLHWLLIAPKGLSITTSDRALRQKTKDVLLRLVELCADLGGTVMVHGSPAQRELSDAASPEEARAHAAECLRAAGEAAQAAGIAYCLEPLASPPNTFIHVVDEAIEFIGEVGSPGLRTMIDTAAAGLMEELSVADTIRAKWPSGHLAHIQLNDRNRRAPGQGDDRFGPILRALRDVGHDGPISVEPFIYEPDGPATAAYAAGYLQALAEEIEAAGAGA